MSSRSSSAKRSSGRCKRRGRVFSPPQQLPNIHSVCTAHRFRISFWGHQMRGVEFVTLWTVIWSIWLITYFFGAEPKLDSEPASAVFNHVVTVIAVVATGVLHWMLLRRILQSPSLVRWLLISAFVGGVAMVAVSLIILFPDAFRSAESLNAAVKWTTSPDAWWALALIAIARSCGYATALLWVSGRTAAYFIIGVAIAAISSEFAHSFLDLRRETNIHGQTADIAILFNCLQSVWLGLLSGAGLWLGSAPVRDAQSKFTES